MGDGMPYHLEKGAFLRIVETHLNQDRARMEATLGLLQQSEANNTLDWLAAADPTMWTDPAFAKSPASGTQTMDRLIEHWFGFVSDGAGGWTRPLPPPPTTGYWIGYRGDVDRIVRRALTWAVELALRTGSSQRVNGRPWPIELFWKCPAPWFEAWVVSRRVRSTSSGLITVVFVSPSHDGAVVADSPIAHSASATPPNGGHPIPSWQDDYEQLDVHHPDPGNFPGRPLVPAADRNHATWVVTHERHVIAGREAPGLGDVDGAVEERERQENTAGPRQPFLEFFVPQLAIWRGLGDIVTVSPSMAAGGVKHDGRV